MKSFRLTPCAGAVAIALLQMAGSASAATCTLNTNGFWQTTTNWSCGSRPGNGDTANINISGIVTINQAEQITTLNNAGTINIDAFLLTLNGGGSTANSGTINVGGASTAALQISAGHNVNNTGGAINVANGSVVNQFGSSITGGTINTAGTGALVAANSSANFLNNVSLNGNLDLATATGIERIGGGLTLNGAINVNNNSILAFQGDQTVGGTGNIVLGDTGSANRINVEAGNLTFGSGITLHGKNGTIGQQAFVGGAATLTNNGTIAADVAGGTINLAINGLVTNNGTLAAQNSGTLLFSTAVTNAGSGHIDAIGAGSTLLQNGGTITGGTINTGGGGALVATNTGLNFLNDATLNGVIDLASTTGIERLGGTGLTMVSGSAINIDINSILTLEGNAGLSGTGTIVLGPSFGRINLENTGTSTIATGILIHGQNGTIGNQSFIGGSPHVLVNNGTLSADVAGGTIDLAPNGGTVNNGTLSAQGGGTLLLNTNVTGTVGSQIIAGAGSAVTQNGITLSGVINNSGTGSFNATNSGSNFLDGVAFTGNLDLATATGQEQVKNGFVLNGEIKINNNSILAFEGNQTVSGNGTITLGNTGSANRVNVEAGNLTLGANVLIHGEKGTIGQQAFIGGASTLTNNGKISADVSGGTITLAINGLTTNNGVLEARNGGTLVLNSNIAGTASGSIKSGAGSTVLQNGVTISGILNTTGSGRFAASNSGANVLNGVNFNGTLDLASIANSRERIINGVTLDGAVNIANGGILSLDSNSTSGGAQTIGGTGVINLNDAAARLTMEGPGSTTLGAGITVRGQGNIGGPAIIVGGNNTLVNNGRISADVSGGTLNIVPPANSGSLTNNGILEAVGGGTLLLSTNVTANAGSQITAGAGSSVVQNGVTISGIINTSGGGLFTASNSGNNILDGVTLNGVLDVASGASSNRRERIINGLTLNGAVNIANGGILSLDSNSTPGGAQSIGGTGAINLNDAAARLTVEGPGSTTLGAGITVRGQGNIGGPAIIAGGNNTLINDGLISADVSGGTLNIVAPANSGSLTNNNILEAKTGGTLLLSTNINNSASGQINAQNTGVVLHNGTIITGGTINTAGSGVFRATSNGSNILNNVTLTGVADLTTVANSRERIINGTTINGAVNIANGGILSLDSNSTPGGAQTIGGTGVINLNDAAARLTMEGTGSTTLGAGLTVRGQGNIGGPAIIAGGNNTLINNGTLLADVSGGTLNIVAPANGGTLAGTGTLQTSGGTLNLATGAPSTQGRLIMGGAGSALNLNTQNLTITNDYTNANFGIGNSFNRRAGITGTGQILASGDAAQAITGTNVSNGTTAAPTLTIGNVHVGSNTFNYQVANSGTTGPAIRGAIQTSVNGGNITDARLSGSGVTAGNYGPVATGAASGNLAVNFTAASAGVLAPLSGQAVHIANNFDNLSQQTLGIVLGSGAAAYNLAAGNATPSPIVFANAHVGDVRTQVLTVTNTAPSGAFTEGLNASFGSNTGNVSNNGGTIALLAGGASNSSSMSASLDTGAAGARSGTVTVGYVSDGTGTSGLGTTGAGSQTINLSGNVYNLASSSVIGAINFGVRHVGDGVITQNVAITNTAPAGLFSEGLDSSFGAFTGSGGSKISTAGLLTNLAAGATDGSTMKVMLDTSTVGMVNGTLHVNQASNGTISGLGNTTLPGQDPAVTADVQSSGTVVRFASPKINTATPVDFGNVRVGSAQSLALSITNNVPNDGFSESLIGSATGTSNTTVTASGAFGAGTTNPPSLAPMATDTTHIVVGIDTASAGAKSGNAILNFKSDGTGFSGGTITDLGNTNVAVQGNVYRLANPTIGSGPVTLAARVGDAGPAAAISIANSSSDIYTEGLSVTRGATAAGFTSSGSITNLSAGASSTAIGVTLDTATAGTFGGTQALNFVSTGAGTTGAADVSVGTGSVALTGKVYTPAVAQLNTPSVGFGIVHVGDVVAQQNVSVTNSASATALNDVLTASFNSASSPFTGNGNLGAGLAAQATDASSLKVGINTGTAGVYSGSASFTAASHNADLSDAALANLVVSLSGQVNNFASDAFLFSGGAGSFTQSGSIFTLDYGTVALGSGTRSTTLLAGNTATGPADLLDGSFAFLDPADFSESGFANFVNFMAGQNTGPLMLSFDSTTIGSFMDTIVLHGIGHNASGYAAAIGDITLIVRGTVAGTVSGVPEPGSLLLLGLGIPLLFVRRKARKAARR